MAELTLAELEQVRGGQEPTLVEQDGYVDRFKQWWNSFDIIPTPPPETSPHYQEYANAERGVVEATSDVATGTVTINRGLQQEDTTDMLVQVGSGLVQVAAGVDKGVDSYLDMRDASSKHLQDARNQSAAADLKELNDFEADKGKQEAQDRENNRLIEQGERRLHDGGAPPANSGGGAPPANADPYYGDLSIPTYIVHPPATNGGEIILEPIGDAYY